MNYHLLDTDTNSLSQIFNLIFKGLKPGMSEGIWNSIRGDLEFCQMGTGIGNGRWLTDEVPTGKAAVTLKGLRGTNDTDFPQTELGSLAEISDCHR